MFSSVSVVFTGCFSLRRFYLCDHRYALSIKFRLLSLFFKIVFTTCWFLVAIFLGRFCNFPGDDIARHSSVGVTLEIFAEAPFFCHACPTCCCLFVKRVISALSSQVPSLASLSYLGVGWRQSSERNQSLSASYDGSGLSGLAEDGFQDLAWQCPLSNS